MTETGLASEALAERPIGRNEPQAALSLAGGLSWLSARQASAIVGEWRELAARGGESNVFFHPGFLLPAIDHLDPDVTIATVRDRADRLIALAPIARTRLGRIAPALRVWVHDYGPLGVPLLDAGAIDQAAAAMVGHTPEKTSLVVPNLPARGPAKAAFERAAGLAGRPLVLVDEHARAICERGDEPGGIRPTLPTRRRKEFARQMRRLAELGDVTIESAVDPDRVRARFEEFLILEAAGWKGEAGTALASQPTTAAFARDVVFNRSERGTTRIVSLRLGEHPVAIVVCFIAGATAFTWKIAHDEAYARFSPGAQLMLETADALFGDSAIARIDSCACADHPMIDHLWRGRMDVATLVVGPVGGGAIYRTGLAAMRAEHDAKAMARRVRTRLKGQRQKREAPQ